MNISILNSFLICLISLSMLHHVNSDDNCGQLKQTNGTILNGANWPWLSSLFYYFNGQYFCSGTLISDRHILSAAHCFSSSNFSTPSAQVFVILGRLNFTQISPFEQIRNVTDIKVLANWKKVDGIYDSDVALLTLSDPIVQTEYVRPICLPKSSKQIGADILNEMSGIGVIVGYNKSQSTHEISHYESNVKNITSCLYGDEKSCEIYGDKFSCISVSGSGFYGRKDNSSSYVIYGIFSKGKNDDKVTTCGLNSFVVFTFVGEYVDWIKVIMNEPFSLQTREGKSLKASTEIFCDYRWNYEQSDPIYQCTIRELVIPSPYTEISKSVLGFHGDDDRDIDVTRIRITKSKTIYLPNTTGLAKKFPNLKNFWVSKSGLKFVERSKLQPLKNITTLCFNENDIEEFPDNTFDDLVNLEILWIYSNKISELGESLFKNLKNLKIIDARNNLLKILHADLFQNNPKLKVVNFSFNSLAEIYIDFTTFKSLKWLVLDSNDCISAGYCKIYDCLKSIKQIQEVVEKNC